MAINKVVLDGNTLIDLTNDTVTEDAVGGGITFHSASGEAKTGTLAAVQYTPQTLTGEQQEQARTNIGAADLHSVGTLQGIVDDITTGVTSVPSAVKATQDGNGNNISTTYAKRISGTNGFEAGGGTGTGTETISIGNGANAIANYGIAIGSDAAGGMASTSQGAIAIGNSANAPAPGSVSIGQNSRASGSPAVAIGQAAIVTASESVQLGAGTNNNSNTLQFRDTQIINADGELTDINTYAGSDYFSIKNPNARNSSSNYYCGVSFRDNNAVSIGTVQGGIFTDNLRKVFLGVNNSSGTFVASLGIETDQAGLQNNTRAYCKKPYNTAENSDTIVTMDLLYPGGNMDMNAVQSGQFRYRDRTFFGIKINTTYLNYQSCWFRLTRVGNLVIVGGSMGVKSTINAHTATTIVTGLPPISHSEAEFCPAVASNNAPVSVKVDTNGNLQVTPESGTSLVSGTQIVFGFIYPTVAN